VQAGFAGAGGAPNGLRLVYLRNRWYDPQTGRLLTQDPIGLAGGVNLYAYAGNDPVQFDDPFGLCVHKPCPRNPIRGGITERPNHVGNFHSPRGHGTRQHHALDAETRFGTPVQAVEAGTIRIGCDSDHNGQGSDGSCGAPGNNIWLIHADGSTTRYVHLDPSMDVKTGDRVVAGQVLGRTGPTGNVADRDCNCPAHLHIEMRDPQGRLIDPEPYIPSHAP
jgi:RHS repeat-associated protein